MGAAILATAIGGVLSSENNIRPGSDMANFGNTAFGEAFGIYQNWQDGLYGKSKPCPPGSMPTATV